MVPDRTKLKTTTMKVCLLAMPERRRLETYSTSSSKIYNSTQCMFDKHVRLTWPSGTSAYLIVQEVAFATSYGVSSTTLCAYPSARSCRKALAGHVPALCGNHPRNEWTKRLPGCGFACLGLTQMAICGMAGDLGPEVLVS